MPQSPGRACRNKRCRAITTNKDGYCDQCRHVKYLNQRPHVGREVYDSNWVKVRDAYLREHPLCEDCEAIGVVRQADMVHHKIPVANGGAMYDEENLRSLCVTCHGKYQNDSYAKDNYHDYL